MSFETAWLLRDFAWLTRALYAGRVLWLIPPDDEATGSAAASEAAEAGDEAGLFQSGGLLPQAPAGVPDSTAQRSACELAPSHLSRKPVQFVC